MNNHKPAGRALALAALALLSILAAQFATLYAQGTAFTYQGLLEANGSPVTGLYDFNFNLFTANSGGSPVTTGSTSAGVSVNNGLFMTTIDFGGIFAGGRYWLEIGSRPNGSSASFQILGPRVWRFTWISRKPRTMF